MSKKDEEECEPCAEAVSVGTALRICRKVGDKKKCEILMEKVINEEISVDDVFRKVRKMAKGDRKALELLDEVEEFAGRKPKGKSKSGKKRKPKR